MILLYLHFMLELNTSGLAGVCRQGGRAAEADGGSAQAQGRRVCWGLEEEGKGVITESHVSLCVLSA